MHISLIIHPIFADNDPDRAAEDCAAAAAGARGAQDRPLLGVRRGRPRPPHGHVRPHRALARLHLVSGSGCTSIAGLSTDRQIESHEFARQGGGMCVEMSSDLCKIDRRCLRCQRQAYVRTEVYFILRKTLLRRTQASRYSRNNLHQTWRA